MLYCFTCINVSHDADVTDAIQVLEAVWGGCWCRGRGASTWITLGKPVGEGEVTCWVLVSHRQQFESSMKTTSAVKRYIYNYFPFLSHIKHLPTNKLPQPSVGVWYTWSSNAMTIMKLTWPVQCAGAAPMTAAASSCATARRPHTPWPSL